MSAEEENGEWRAGTEKENGKQRVQTVVCSGDQVRRGTVRRTEWMQKRRIRSGK